MIPNDSSGAFGELLHVIDRKVGHGFVSNVSPATQKRRKSAEARYMSPIANISDPLFGKGSPRVRRD